MEDDEEYSYSGYSADTAAAIGGKNAGYAGEDEEYSYTAYADEELAAASAEEEVTHSYGDFIIEEFSSEVNVPRLAKLTKLPQKVVKYIFSAIYLIVGVLCVAITDTVTDALPYIIGSMMVIIGLGRFISAVIHGEYKSIKTNETATSLIMLAMGIMIIVEHDWAITFIAIVWGILGLFEGAHAFNHAFKRIANSERCIYYLIKGIIELVFAFMLLYEPDHHISLHIIIFGVQLIFDAVTMAPRVKEFLSSK